ncbi:Pfs, NB-ARC and TPR domain protein [Talaromyces stipitatus ATCC 10500]|uniref:Pfs, NB-ARC and TPR domain protein n=1 Tax=Talaromyces stipitatus (strain ATCC 10500 / CBS 375.48 / QM 6759 / NRRL 1006) TaxID=441959 RepID=B8M7M4_TALSN|nr:Pfs, NB-ARC and TPR domain protein [Talaromyces stipitatus ATCC 10500]EED19577.1 Pfs, NB-ARC and TPR domain protein [Talaromyces stipitatus ATCC 10500]
MHCESERSDVSGCNQCVEWGVKPYGTGSAASLAGEIRTFFPNIWFGLLVGVAAGLPNLSRTPPRDIRLGDVLVGIPEGDSAGLIAYDLGKETKNGFQPLRGGHVLSTTEKIVRAAIGHIKIESPNDADVFLPFYESIKDKEHADGTFRDPGQDQDNLYEVDESGIERLVKREQRPDSKRTRAWYGSIGSGEKLMKKAEKRNELRDKYDVIGLEMEAAGTMNQIPVGVIRGVCDYGDEHKNKEWQPYAAAMAAAYAKAIDIPLDLTDVPAIENFLGRNQELERLWHYLQPGNSKSRKVAILHGLGGMGKTQLAIHFARVHKDDFTAIFWMSGKSRETLLQALSSVLPRLPGQSQTTKAINKEEIEQHARHVLQWLSIPGNLRWLLIFDNIDQYSPVHGGPADGYDISEFFPTADHGSILITSRMQSLTELGEPFPIRKLESESAIQLLLQRSSLPVPDPIRMEVVDQDVIALTDRLGGLPLAIVIAGAYMRETGTSISEYLQYYQKSWHKLQSRSRPERHYPHGNILQTWMVSYDGIKKRDTNAAELILLLAHFDNRDIWYELVECGTYSSNPPEWLETVTSDRLDFKESIRILIGFSLIEIKKHGGSYMMHPVVQDWCLHIADMDDVKASQLNELALVCVGYTVPSTTEQRYWEIQRRLLAHADRVHQRWNNDELIGDSAIWGAFNNLGNLYGDQGKLKEAEEMHTRALAGREKALGPDHTSTLDSVHSLGILYQNQDKLKEAKEMYTRALAGYEKELGPDHTSTLLVVNNLGILYWNQGKLKGAEEMYTRALAGYEKALGPDHISTLLVVNNLGILYWNQGKLKGAEEMYTRALAGYEKALGPDHTSTLDSVHSLGVLYGDQGKLKEAEEMHTRALAGREKELGPDHTSTLDSIHSLGVLYRDQGKLKEAEEMYTRALAGYGKALGPDHHKTQRVGKELKAIVKSEST